MEAIIYDLDGTLLDTENISTQAIQMVIDPYDVEMTWNLKMKILGLNGRDWSTIVIQELGLEGKITCERMVEEWQENLTRFYPNVKKLPGVSELVDYFHNVAKIPQGVATSSKSYAVAEKRKYHEDIFRCFDVVVCGDDPNVKRGKPHPDIFLTAATRLGVTDFSKCIAFEDSCLGVQAAKAAGMYVVAIPDSRIDPVKFSMADEILSSLAEFNPQKFLNKS